jgi:hypothetical protein
MNQLFNGSLDLTKILEKAKEGHSAFSKSAKNGHVYFNITQWVNDEPNEYGQHSSLLLNSTSDKRDAEGKVYIGNAKKAESKAVDTPVSVSDLPDVDDLPF